MLGQSAPICDAMPIVCELSPRFGQNRKPNGSLCVRKMAACGSCPSYREVT